MISEKNLNPKFWIIVQLWPPAAQNLREAAQSWPIRGQYSGHVTYLDQSEAVAHDSPRLGIISGLVTLNGTNTQKYIFIVTTSEDANIKELDFSFLYCLRWQ